MRPVARVVRAPGHVAERRDHFLMADNAGIRQCRCVYLAVCTKRLLRLLRCHGRRRKSSATVNASIFITGSIRWYGTSVARSLCAPTRHPRERATRRGLGRRRIVNTAADDRPDDSTCSPTRTTTRYRRLTRPELNSHPCTICHLSTPRDLKSSKSERSDCK